MVLVWLVLELVQLHAQMVLVWLVLELVQLHVS
jgi:hypothetical protein